MEEAINAMTDEVVDREVKVNLEYRFNNMNYVTVQRSDTNADVAKTLLLQGLLMVENRKEKKLQELVR